MSDNGGQDGGYDGGSYGYRPSLAWGAVFSVVFGLIAVGQFIHVVRSRLPWMMLFVVGAVAETIGWVSRTAASKDPFSDTLFLMQISTLIIGPSWTQAGLYLTLWVIIQGLGQHVSPVAPATYLLSCFLVDVVCLSLQAVGGGMAGSASGTEDTHTGTTIMVSGIVAQLAVACAFVILLVVVLRRGRSEIRLPANRKLLHIAIAGAVAITMLIMRNIYRSIELLQGWTGYLISHERFVLALDALPMAIAMGVYVVIPPSVNLPHRLKKPSQGDDNIEEGSHEMS